MILKLKFYRNTVPSEEDEKTEIMPEMHNPVAYCKIGGQTVRTAARRTYVVDQTDHTQLIASSESELWHSFEQSLLRGIAAKFSDGKNFLISLKNSSCSLPLETGDKIR